MKSTPCGECFSGAQKCDYARFLEDLRFFEAFLEVFLAAFRFFAAIVLVRFRETIITNVCREKYFEIFSTRLV